MVTVEGGEKLKGKEYYPDVAISLPGVETKADLLIIPLGDSQVLLHTVCLQSLGPTLWDFSRKTLKFWQNKKPILLQRVSLSAMEIIGEDTLDKIIMTKGIAYAIQLCANTTSIHTAPLPNSLRILLEEFEDILTIPKEFPSQITCDYHLNLTDPNFTMNARLYKYPLHQKGEIEKQIAEMLQLGVIRTSVSPFASFVVLVKKFDGSWRIHMDYRFLNQHTYQISSPYHS